MPIVGLGTDLANVERFRKFIRDEKKALLRRLFTIKEQEYAYRKHDPAPHLAARFAAKEACLKAFGTGWRDGIRWKDIEVVQNELGQPRLEFSGRVAEMSLEKQIKMVHLSYTHDGEYAVATVILESQ